MADIKIYLAEPNNVRRGLARGGHYYLVRLNKFDTVIAASNNYFIIRKNKILFFRSLTRETCRMGCF